MPDVPSLVPSLSDFAGHWIAAIVLFVLLFLWLAFVFVRARALSMFLGFARTLASLFTSPFVYLRSACLKLADFGDRGDTEYRSSRLYLVNKLLIALHAILIITALSGLAATALSAWDSFLPPKFIREAEAALEERLATDRKELAPAAARLVQLEEDWKTQRQVLIDKHRSDRQRKLDAAVQDSASIDTAASSNEQLSSPLASIRNYLSDSNVPRNTGEIGVRYESVVQFVNRLQVSDEVHGLLVRYAEDWRTRVTMTLELAAVSEDDVRAQAQPDYREVKQKATAFGERVQSEEQDLVNVRAQKKYSPGALLLRLVLGLFAFIVVVWFLGLFIEVVSLSVYAADDLRRLRELSEEHRGHAEHVEGRADRS